MNVQANQTDLTLVPQTAKSQLTEIVANITGRRFCSYHQGNATEGEDLMRNGIKKFMCRSCMSIRKIKPTLS